MDKQYRYKAQIYDILLAFHAINNGYKTPDTVGVFDVYR